FIGVFVSLPCPKPDSGTYEEVMAAAAKKRGLKIGTLEEVGEQFAVMASLPDRLAIEGIKEYAGHPERAQAIVERMIALYNAGKYDDLYRLAIEEGPKNPADSKLFMDKVIVERNRHMVERMGGILERGNALIVVGALHFPGKDGIIDLLRRQHYKVSEIDASGGTLP
ncbi:MAG TPA: TraB/GumN family protein, partial [Stellaceae bacterium]|nr:TraB/GumN family protein [Stellaceae bacterium]